MNDSEGVRQAIQYGNRRIAFDVVRSSTVTDRVRITVDPMVGVRVLAPIDATDSDVRAAVQRRAPWVCKYLAADDRAVPRGRGISGEQILYLGRRYMLKVVKGDASSAKLVGGMLKVTVPPGDSADPRSLVRSWYSERAGRYFRRRVAHLFTPNLDGGDSAPELRLQWMRRQWGSCSPAGRITLNPLLVRAPRTCVDYVIVHELCHRQHHDHGAAFRRLLTARMPDWAERKELLEFYAGEVLGE